MDESKVVNSLIADVPKAVAAGVVDMASGMLMAIKTVDSHPQEVLDVLAAATADLFEGQMVKQIEAIFRKVRGQKEDGSYFQEIIVTSRNLVHVFKRVPGNDGQVVCCVCRVDVNLGMALTKTRQIISA